MKDQADRLRQIIEGLKLRQASQAAVLEAAQPKPRSTRVITVTSGKGGVGKTNITINLAIALSEMGLRVIILDADFGLSNVDILFGIIPKFSLVDVINNQKSIFEVLADGPNNIKFISGGSGVEELVRLDDEQRKRVIDNIGLLDKLADIVLIDTGAGLSDNVMSFVMAADEVLVITTPDPTSITDAYALIKMASNRGKNSNIRIIVNRAETVTEAKEVLNKITVAAEKFLSLKLDSLGYILQDDSVMKAVKQQQPFTLSFPKSQAARHIHDVSRNLMDGNEGHQYAEDIGIRGFVRRLVSFIGT